MSQKWCYLLEKDIPEWIRSSPYLESLLENGPLPEKGLQVSEWCLKKDTTINCHNDALRFLRTIRYWLLPDELIFAVSFLEYCFLPGRKIGDVEELEREHPLLQGLASVVAAPEGTKVAVAAAHGCRNLLKYLCDDLWLAPDSTAGKAAIQCGSLSCLQYLHVRGLKLTNKLASEAINCRNMPCLRYLHQNGVRFTMDALSQAVDENSSECLEYMLQKSTIRSVHLRHSSFAASCKLSAQYGDLCISQQVLKYVKLSKIFEAIILGAGEGGRLQLVKFCIEQGIEVPGKLKLELLNVCARGKYLACLQYLYSIGFVGDHTTFRAAAEGGSLDCVCYLFEQNCPPDRHLCTTAAKHGHYDVLVFARELMFPWVEATCEAASKSSLACLAFAHQNGCPWDTYTCIAAAGAGRLECLQYAFQQGCPWDERTCQAAARGGHLSCLVFAHENGCPWKVKSKTSAVLCENIVLSAAGAPTVDCLRYVLEHGARVRRAAAFNAARAGCLQSLQLLHSRGCPWDESVCTEAVRQGALDCLQFAHEHGCPWNCSAYMATLRSARQYRLETGCDLVESLDWEDRMSACAEYLAKNNCSGISINFGRRPKILFSSYAL